MYLSENSGCKLWQLHLPDYLVDVRFKGIEPVDDRHRNIELSTYA